MSEGVSLKVFIGRRILFAIPTILMVITMAFLIIHSIPGDPILAFVGDFGVSGEYVELLREKYGLT